MFTCDLCSKTFIRKDSLKRHVNEIHYGQTTQQLEFQPSFHAYVKKYENETIPSFHTHMKKYENEIVGKVLPTQINENTEISGENYELGYGIRIS